MFDTDPRGEHATRDVGSGGIYAEMRKKFSGMVKRCAHGGFDLAAGKVEVVPTADYFMGGIVVDADTRAEMEGLYGVSKEDRRAMCGGPRPVPPTAYRSGPAACIPLAQGSQQ